MVRFESPGDDYKNKGSLERLAPGDEGDSAKR